MKKLKSLLRQLIGRSKQQSLTIDIVTPTIDGQCVIGWYFTSEVSSLAIADKEGIEIPGKQIDIERQDVEASTGQSAKGFQLTVKTNKSLSELNLLAKQTNGQIYTIPLTSALVDEHLGPIHSTATGSIAGCFELGVITGKYLFLAGWLIDDRQATEFVISNGRTNIVKTKNQFLRFRRADVAEPFGRNYVDSAGILLLCELSDDATFDSEKPLFVNISLKDGDTSVKVDQIYCDEPPMQSARRILNSWNPLNPHHIQNSDIVAKPLQSLYARQRNVSTQRYDFGVATDNPEASFVIPLYGRFDFMQYQISHFERAGYAQNCEIIYVVDDPKIAAKTLRLAQKLSRMFKQSFSVLVLGENVGFGPANNIGVRHAKADKLILMNSDVLPSSADWFERMLTPLNDETTGIVGARLLFEDRAIQHDGMAPMTISEYPGLLFNDHPYKGWPEKLSPHASTLSECALVTAACWAVKKADFISLGGFDPIYVLGDFEDSDLCLKMLKNGKKNYICRDAVLFHLERQSQNLVDEGKWKHSVTIINAITYNKRWKAELEKIRESEEVA